MHRDPIIVIRTIFRVVGPTLLWSLLWLCVFGLWALLWLYIFGLGLLIGTACRGCPHSMPDLVGLRGWAIASALMALVTGVPILFYVLALPSGTAAGFGATYSEHGDDDRQPEIGHAPDHRQIKACCCVLRHSLRPSRQERIGGVERASPAHTSAHYLTPRGSGTAGARWRSR